MLAALLVLAVVSARILSCSDRDVGEARRRRGWAGVGRGLGRREAKNSEGQADDRYAEENRKKKKRGLKIDERSFERRRRAHGGGSRSVRRARKDM